LELWDLKAHGLWLEVPWGGRSPRVLTAGYVRFTLKTQGEKKHVRSGLSGQYDLWPTDQKGSLVYQGAPLLNFLVEGE